MIETRRFPPFGLESDIAAFQDELNSILKHPHTETRQILQYVLEAKGKQIRPLLVLSFCRLFGYEQDDRYQLAAAVEYIHTASLVHDDIIDEAETRRGRKTVHQLWGEKTAVLIGDFFYSRAFELIARIKNPMLVQIFAKVANRLSLGELKQLVMGGAQGLQQGDEWCYEVMREKTAVFFGACCEAAALISGATSHSERARRFGCNLGMVFQMRDDILDYGTDSGKVAKDLLQDLSKGKVTLPLLYTYSSVTQEEQRLIEQALDSPQETRLEKITQLVRNSAALALMATKAKSYSLEATELLEQMPAGEVRASLAFLVEDLIWDV